MTAAKLVGKKSVKLRPGSLNGRRGFRFEKAAQENGFHFIVGIDESGRGPLAGPVVAAAVLLYDHEFCELIRNSKRLSAEQREVAFHEIMHKATVGVGVVSETVIDSINILRASYHAMVVAVTQLIGRMPAQITGQPDFEQKVHLLVDGNSFKSDLPYSYKTIIDGDNLCLSIACASIVAKVIRDRILHTYDCIFPHWGFAKHKGYATKEHRAAIKKFGVAPIHRHSFLRLINSKVESPRLQEELLVRALEYARR